VVDAGPLDVRPVALGRGVVEAQQDAIARGDDLGEAAEQQRRHEAGPAPEGAEEVVIALVVRAESGGAEPGGDGASALGEEETAQQR
jgi:hypothetical protein